MTKDRETITRLIYHLMWRFPVKTISQAIVDCTTFRATHRTGRWAASKELVADLMGPEEDTP